MSNENYDDINDNDDNDDSEERKRKAEEKRFEEVKVRMLELKADAIKVDGTEDYSNVFFSLLKAEDGSVRNNRHYWVMGLDEDGYILCVYIFSVNPQDRMKITPKAVYKVALLVEAVNIVLAYNVVEGEDLTPKGLDIDFFNKMFNAAFDFEMNVIDTMVISPDGYHSDHEDGYLKYYLEDESFKLVYNVRDFLEKAKKKYAKKKTAEAEKKILAAERKALEATNKARKDIATFMLKSGEDLDRIMLYTGLNTAEINDLRKDLGM